MNKQQIKAELRRSACEDKNPWIKCDYKAWNVALWKWCEQYEVMNPHKHEQNRIFFLLVAEAL